MNDLPESEGWNIASRRCRANQALRYSSQALSRVNSVDHSVLKHSSSASIQGFSSSRRSRIWTVFSSMKRPPVSQEVTIFCASCVCGPAAGPTGVAQVSPKTLTVLPLRVSKTVAREYQRLSVVVGIHQICASKVPQTEWDA